LSDLVDLAARLVAVDSVNPGLVAGGAGAGSVFWLMSAMLVASAVAIRRPVPRGPVPPEAAAEVP
jgi:hypothetical protein